MTKYALHRFVSTLLLLAFAGLTACVAEEATPQLVDPTGFVTYVHPSGVFTLDLPPEWVVNDTSDATALNVEFSPPNSPEPLVSVYVVTEDALGGSNTLPAEDFGVTPEAAPQEDINALADVYVQTFYTLSDAIVKDMVREPQPDGSVRIKFLIDAPQGTSQHNDFIQLQAPYFVALRIRLPEDHAQMRTLARVVNTLAVNQGAGWTSALPDDRANRTVVEFASLNAWTDRNNGFEVAGQIVNNAPLALEFVRITAQLYDAQNRLLTEQDDFVSSDLVLPGEYAPFSIVFSDGLPPGTVRYDLHASARYTDFSARTFYGPDNFALTSDANFDESGLLVVSGQVRNEGNLTANLVKVIVTVFDAQQRVIATDTTLVDEQQLAQGDSSTYSVTFVELGGTPNTFLVTAQAIIQE